MDKGAVLWNSCHLLQAMCYIMQSFCIMQYRSDEILVFVSKTMPSNTLLWQGMCSEWSFVISYSIVWCPNKATLKSHGLSGVARVAELGGGNHWQGFASGRTSIYARPKGLTLYWQGVWEPFKTPRSINDSGRMSHSEYGMGWDIWLFNLAWSLLFVCREPFRS